jgi:hypothetical protein
MSGRSIVVGSLGAGCLSLIGHGTYAIFRGNATIWTYALVGIGAFGISAILLYIRRLRQKHR